MATDLTAADLAARIEGLDAETLIAGAFTLSDVSLTPESRARLALEQANGAAYTDLEWTMAKRNLLDFFGILAEWKESEVRRQ